MPVVPCEIVTEPTVPGTSASHASDAIPKDCTPEKGGGCGGTPAGQQQKAAERRRAQQQQLHKYHSAESRWIDDIPEAPVFRPSAEEFADPLAYICKIQGEVSKWGICKIIPPVSAAVPGSTVLLEQGPYTFTTRQQVVRKPAVTSLDKLKFYASGKNYSIVNYEKTANEFSYRRYNMAGGLPSRFVEAEYWREWHSGNNLVVEYGNDVEGSAFSDEEWDPLASSRWNFKTLPVERDSILRHIPMAIPGVTAPMLYIGMLFSTFGWHVEDQYMHSVNFHHYGAPKTWYGVPANHADGFEEVVMQQVYSGSKEAQNMTRNEFAMEAVKAIAGKTTMFPPHHLMEAGVRVCRCVQQPGEFVVTYPRSYHGGFSHGYNCGEAVNFATADWFPYGLAATTRYSMLNLPPIMSVEALLCVEAKHLAEREEPSTGTGTSEKGHEGGTGVMQVHTAVIQKAHCRLMLWQNNVRRILMENGAVCCRMPCTRVPLLACFNCSQLCYLATVLQNDPEYSQKAMCLRCAHGRSSTAGQMTIMCHPDVESLEGLAKQWTSQHEEVAATLGDLETPLGDGAQSKLLEEPGWWEVDGCRELELEWVGFPAFVTSAPQQWIDIVDNLSSSTGGHSRSGAGTEDTSVAKPPKKASKRKKSTPGIDKKRKLTKSQPNRSSWANVLRSGTTGVALGCALDRDSPASEADDMNGSGISSTSARGGTEGASAAEHTVPVALKLKAENSQEVLPPVTPDVHFAHGTCAPKVGTVLAELEGSESVKAVPKSTAGGLRANIKIKGGAQPSARLQKEEGQYVTPKSLVNKLASASGITVQSASKLQTQPRQDDSAKQWALMEASATQGAMVSAAFSGVRQMLQGQLPQSNMAQSVGSHQATCHVNPVCNALDVSAQCTRPCATQQDLMEPTPPASSSGGLVPDGPWEGGHASPARRHFEKAGYLPALRMNDQQGGGCMDSSAIQSALGGFVTSIPLQQLVPGALSPNLFQSTALKQVSGQQAPVTASMGHTGSFAPELGEVFHQQLVQLGGNQAFTATSNVFERQPRHLNFQDQFPRTAQPQAGTTSGLFGSQPLYSQGAGQSGGSHRHREPPTPWRGISSSVHYPFSKNTTLGCPQPLAFTLEDAMKATRASRDQARD